MRSKKIRDYNSSRYSKSKKKSANSRTKITNSKKMWITIFIIFIIVLFFIMYINQYVQISRKSFMVEKLQDKKRKLQSKKEHLQLKIAELKSLDRVERIAKEELNMEQPDNINYIVINSNESETKLVNKDKSKKTGDKVKEEKEKLAYNLEDMMFEWINELTTVQAGTLGE